MEGVCALIIVLQYIHLNNMVDCPNRCSDRFRDLEMSVKEKLIHHFCKKIVIWYDKMLFFSSYIWLILVTKINLIQKHTH